VRMSILALVLVLMSAQAVDKAFVAESQADLLNARSSEFNASEGSARAPQPAEFEFHSTTHCGQRGSPGWRAVHHHLGRVCCVTARDAAAGFAAVGGIEDLARCAGA
jgi:hypothetical protein